MEFFFVLFVVGTIALAINRINQMNREVGTIHCIQHKWIINDEDKMYCENCKGSPE